MAFYRKKPVVIEAVQWGTNCKFSEVTPWVSDALDRCYLFRWEDEIRVETLEGVMIARPGDYIIRGVKGELYPCKPDIFLETNELCSAPCAGEKATGA